MSGLLFCGIHRAEIRMAGGLILVGEVTSIIRVDWERKRDDISLANVWSAITYPECAWLGNIQTGVHELHLYRNDVPVWQGPITRLEYRKDIVEIYASDILWVAKNKALESSYNNKYPNVKKVGYMMSWLLKEQTFSKADWAAWNMSGRVHWVQMDANVGEEPKTTRAVLALSTTTWEDFDKYAEDSGMDYTVIGRDIYFWDTHYRWNVLPPLIGKYVAGDTLAVVEYGNELATRVYVTNGSGKASKAEAPADEMARYPSPIEHVISSWNEAAGTATPAAEDLAAWVTQSKSLVDRSSPAPVRVRLGENSSLMPDAPYDINDLMAGAWLIVRVEKLARTMEEWHKVEHLGVREEGGGETVTISTVSAPRNALDP
jgi:hypothetical protein